jgi:hypothetical protein
MIRYTKVRSVSKREHPVSVLDTDNRPSPCNIEDRKDRQESPTGA